MFDGSIEAYTESMDAEAELQIVLRSMAENRRRRALFRAADRNLKQVQKIWGLDPNAPIPKNFIEDDNAWWPCKEPFEKVYEAAVEANEYEAAFALAEYVQRCTADLLALAEKGVMHPTQDPE
jgi:hypothetical protein